MCSFNDSATIEATSDNCNAYLGLQEVMLLTINSYVTSEGLCHGSSYTPRNVMSC